MKRINWLVFSALALLAACQTATKTNNDQLFSKNNLVAWCIVPFDSLERTPEQRSLMLNELGIKHLAYDWRTKHLPTFPDEIKALHSHGISLHSVWLWVEPDSAGILGKDNEQIFKTVHEANVKTDFWIGFSNKYFEGLSDEQRLDRAVNAVQYLEKRASEIGCRISLYNHGDWFGEPANQVQIIQKSGLKDVGIVYNFHHAHLQMKEFPTLLPKMLPYLRTVNINGMREVGPQILTVGQGDHELTMLKELKASGFNGSIGILCHKEADAKVILDENMRGLQTLLKEMGDESALSTN